MTPDDSLAWESAQAEHRFDLDAELEVARRRVHTRIDERCRQEAARDALMRAERRASEAAHHGFERVRAVFAALSESLSKLKLRDVFVDENFRP